MPFPGTWGHGDLPWDVHEDTGTCPGMTQVSQGHGDLPWDVHGDLLQVVPNFTGTRGPAPGRPRFHRDVRT